MNQIFIRDERGATAIEYGLISSLLAVIVISALAFVATNLSTTFEALNNDEPLTQATSTPPVPPTCVGGDLLFATDEIGWWTLETRTEGSLVTDCECGCQVDDAFDAARFPTLEGIILLDGSPLYIDCTCTCSR